MLTVSLREDFEITSLKADFGAARFSRTKILPAPAHAVAGLLELLKRGAVTGSDVFDLQIVATIAVATMQANDIRRVYTIRIV